MTLRSLVAMLALVVLAGCATYPDYAYGPGYRPRDDVRYYDPRTYDRRMCGDCGEIVEIDRVRLRDRASGGGAVLGAIIGGVLGNTIGRGDGRRAATVAGAVAGGFAGNAIERDSNDAGMARYAWRITVRLDDGRWADVVQRDPRDLRRGDRVVVRDHTVYRIR
ncbi:MAG: glycine zipper 2TM domain-containing protein [Xanthomonadales bacterium]|nr:glycine zipper 2TM domain-containing protein [Xanthomonadales bacterium]